MNKQICNPGWVELFLEQQMSAKEQADFELHLDSCDHCRCQLEASAASEEIWAGVRESVPFTDDLDRRSSVNSAANDELWFSHDSVLQMLAPTDNDRMMGRLGTYEVVGVIGSGGMGIVLKGFDASLNRYVAIKVLAPHLCNSGTARRRFLREAQAAAAVVHDNVIEIHAIAEAGGLSYLVMPYVRGPSLQRRLDQEGPLALAEILRIGMQITEGLAAAHAQGLVHRDVKPANILLANGVERVKLTDFGLARAVDDASLTRTGIIAGTPQYMSPEQTRGESVDYRSDLFSLGSVMYTMCTGRAPFRAETSYGMLRRIADESPRPIREINPDIPDWLCEIIDRLMAKRAEDRFESAREVAGLLKDCLAHVQQPTVVPLPKHRIVFHRKKLSVSRAERATAILRWPSAFKLFTAAALVLATIFAGVLIVLETNKGVLTIKSEVDDVPIRIMHGNQVVEELAITRTGASVRIAAGQYLVEIDGAMDGVFIENETIQLQRGGREIVNIVHQDSDTAPQTEGLLPSPLLEEWSDARITSAYPFKVEFERGQTTFIEGDDITILEVRGTAETLTPGNAYWIRGTYELGSHEQATLAAYTTSHNDTSKSVNKVKIPTNGSQQIIIEQGTGIFTLILPMYSDGWPHVSFYPLPGGNGFGGTYFGTGESAWGGVPRSKQTNQKAATPETPRIETHFGTGWPTQSPSPSPTESTQNSNPQPTVPAL
jgi:serine/threonine protein kinase